MPFTVNKFTVPLGCLINMDGTAIYFSHSASSLWPSRRAAASRSLTMLMCVWSLANGVSSVFIDRFLDRFRTTVNVSGDIFAATIVTKLASVKDNASEISSDEEEHVVREVRENTQRV